MPWRTILSSGMPAGSARAPSSKPQTSRLPSGLSGMSLAGRRREVADAVREVDDRLVRQLHRHDLHQAAGELRRAVRRVRLADLHAVDQARREQIERHDLLVRLGRRQHRPGQRRVAVALAQAADEHVLVVDERQPGDARHRRRGVAVAVLLHLLRADVVGDDRGVLALDELRLRRRRLGTDDGGRDGDRFGEPRHRQADVRRDRPLARSRDLELQRSLW